MTTRNAYVIATFLWLAVCVAAPPAWGGLILETSHSQFLSDLAGTPTLVVNFDSTTSGTTLANPVVVGGITFTLTPSTAGDLMTVTNSVDTLRRARTHSQEQRRGQLQPVRGRRCDRS